MFLSARKCQLALLIIIFAYDRQNVQRYRPDQCHYCLLEVLRGQWIKLIHNVFKREKVSACASSDCVLPMIKPNMFSYPKWCNKLYKSWQTRANNRLWKYKQSADFENLNNQRTLEMLNISRIWKCKLSADFENVKYQQNLKMQIISWFKRCKQSADFEKIYTISH